MCRVRPSNFGATGFWLLAQPLGAKAPPTGEAAAPLHWWQLLLWEGLQPREPAAGRQRAWQLPMQVARRAPLRHMSLSFVTSCRLAWRANAANALLLQLCEVGFDALYRPSPLHHD